MRRPAARRGPIQWNRRTEGADRARHRIGTGAASYGGAMKQLKSSPDNRRFADKMRYRLNRSTDAVRRMIQRVRELVGTEQAWSDPTALALPSSCESTAGPPPQRGSDRTWTHTRPVTASRERKHTVRAKKGAATSSVPASPTPK